MSMGNKWLLSWKQVNGYDGNQMLIDGDTIPLSKIRVTRLEQVEI